eukprot:m51a1_g12755 putative aminopeptidase (167) ;mRNA; r:2334-2931
MRGATQWLRSLSDAERAGVVAYINVDSVGSANWVHVVGDPRTAPPALRNASAVLARALSGYYEAARVPYEYAPMGSVRSDHRAFLAYGIPSALLTSDTGAPKNATQFARYGGVLNALTDPCHHLPCDTTDNIGLQCLEDEARAVAQAIQDLGTQKGLREKLKAVSP